MRNVLVATLALAPVLVHAQALSPAQRGAQAPVLESKLVSPNAVNGTPSPNAIPTSELHWPKLIKYSDISEDYSRPDSSRQQERAFSVLMTVSADGVPTHLKIVKSDDPILNYAVLEAVAKYRFAPGSLHSRPTEVPLVLKVNVLPHQAQ